MTADRPDVTVQHRLIHRSDPTDVAAAIRTRLPDVDCHVATTAAESTEYLRDAEVAVGVYLSREDLAEAADLEWFQAVSAGVGHLPRERLREQDVTLTTASGVHAVPTSEQVLAYMLAFERDLLRAFEQKRRREFRHWSGGELRGKTLGVVGLGEIGSRVARLGSALEMTVVGTKRDLSTAPDAVDEVRGPAGTDWVCARSDYLVLACPLTEETEGLIDETKLGAMPSDAILINVARGGVVDQDALIGALQRGEIDGAALDVFETEPLPRESPLWDLANVLVTPHMAGSTPEYWNRLADIFAHNYECYVDGDRDAMENRAL
jgi:phosphoglycerate dehydrogenase-like enzyme